MAPFAGQWFEDFFASPTTFLLTDTPILARRRALTNNTVICYYCVVILSWTGREAERLWSGSPSRRLPPNIQRSARRKLLMLHAAVALSDLKIPPGNRLHALSGDRAGQHSISINDQWRICFVWREGNAHDVEITDYHS